MNRSTIVVVGALATGLVASVQIHYGSNFCNRILKVKKGLESIKGEITAFKEEMVTKEDLKNLSDEVARQNTYLDNAESTFSRYPK